MRWRVLGSRWIAVVLMALGLGAAVAGARTGARAGAAASPCTPPSGITVPCAQRLAITLPAQEPLGRYIHAPLRDRWGTGDLAFRICEQPPGGVTTCRSGRLGPGEARGYARLDLRRTGGYEVSVTAADGGVVHRRLIWVAHPDGRLTLLAAGDSEMEILDTDLAADLAPYRVRVVGDARPSTGLTVPGAFSWPTEAARDVARLHPDLTVVALGANEGYADRDGATPENCCGAGWTAGYAQLVGQMVATLQQGHAGHVYWMVLPTPQPARFQMLFNSVNAGVREAQARSHHRLSLLNADAFFTPGDRYRNAMTYDGENFTIHETDGIHLDATADAVEARLIVARLLADHEIRPEN